MSSKSALPRVFFGFAALAALFLTSLPTQARPAHRPATGRQAVAVPGDTGLSGLWRLVVSLWAPGTAKEGMSIDPNGNNNHAGTSTTPPGGLTDEGTSIDPDGRK